MKWFFLKSNVFLDEGYCSWMSKDDFDLITEAMNKHFKDCDVVSSNFK